MTERPRLTVFLDRDGTINRKAADGDYVKSPDELTLLPGAAEAIRRLNALGARVVVITNQRGIALGRMTEPDLHAVHERLRDELRSEGAFVDAIYHCPHDLDACDCRKPGTGLFLRAASDLGVDLERSVVVGDSDADVLAANALNVRAIRVGDGAETLLEAVDVIERECA